MKKLLFFFLIIIVMSNCALVKQMLPSGKTSKKSIKPSNIKEEPIKDTNVVFDVISIKGYQEPHTPPLVKPSARLEEFLLDNYNSIDLNRSLVYKYYNPNYTSKTIQVLVPGIYSGVGTVANLAEAIVLRSPETEVWVWERRSNFLEDRRLFIKAKANNDIKLITDNFIPQTYKPKENAIFVPTTEDISFAGFWGFNVLSGDLFNVLAEAKLLNKKVILSGYSLGVMYVTNFLANNFIVDDKNIPGYSMVDGSILYDGPSQIDSYVKTEKVYNKGIYIFPPGNYIHGTDSLENSKIFPCNTDGTGSIDLFFKMESKALLASIAPDEIAPVMFKSGLTSYKITNLASALIETDDNYAPFKLFSGSLGRASAKHFGIFAQKSTVSVAGLFKNKDYIDWLGPENFPDEEFNSIPEFLEIVSNETYNSSEWYQPTRIILDFGSINKNDTSNGWQSKYFAVTENSKVNIPMLAIGLSRGLVTHEDLYESYFKSTAVTDKSIFIVDDILHFDADTMTGYKKQPFADLTVNWINSY